MVNAPDRVRVVEPTHPSCRLRHAEPAHAGGRERERQRRAAESDVPVSVAGGHEFVDIATGNGHTCATTSAGELYCWGYNEWGELGNGEVSPGANPLPVLVHGGLTWKTP